MCTAFCEKVVRGPECWPREILCPVKENRFINHSQGYIIYLEALRGITAESLQSWRGASCGDQPAWGWDLSSVFRFVSCVKRLLISTCSIPTSDGCAQNTGIAYRTGICTCLDAVSTCYVVGFPVLYKSGIGVKFCLVFVSSGRRYSARTCKS